MSAQEKEKPNDDQPRTRLERLQCWPEVKEMLQSSVPIPKIVKHIQDVRGEYLDVGPRTLDSTIRQWINRNHAKLVDMRIPVKYLNLLESSIDHIDTLSAANMLFAVQMDRVLMTYAQEKQKGKINPANTADIKLSDHIIRTMSLLESDGFKRRMAKLNADSKDKSASDTMQSIERVKNHLTERYGAQAAAVALSDESRTRVYNAISRIRKGDTEPVLKLLRDNSAKAKEIADRDNIEAKNDDTTPEPPAQ